MGCRADNSPFALSVAQVWWNGPQQCLQALTDVPAGAEGKPSFWATEKENTWGARKWLAGVLTFLDIKDKRKWQRSRMERGEQVSKQRAARPSFQVCKSSESNP